MRRGLLLCRVFSSGSLEPPGRVDVEGLDLPGAAPKASLTLWFASRKL